MHLTHTRPDPRCFGVLSRGICYDTSLPGQYGVALPGETVWEENITDKYTLTKGVQQGVGHR